MQILGFYFFMSTEKHKRPWAHPEIGNSPIFYQCQSRTTALG